MDNIEYYINHWDGDPDDNLFKNETNEQQFFCEKFPLMQQIKDLDNFNWKQNVGTIYEYDCLLDELESDLNYYLNDCAYDFLLTEWQKIYLKGYLGYLRLDFAIEGEKLCD